MIIENNNNENNIINNNNFFINNNNKFIHMLKKILFFLFMFIMLLFASYKINFYYKEILHIKKEKNYINNEDISLPSSKMIISSKRKLNSTSNNNIPNGNFKSLNLTSHTDKEENIEFIREKFNGDYSFILNISSNDYIGNWSKFSSTKNNFFDKNINEGIAELFFQRTKNRNNLIINLKSRTNSFRIDAILREGKYIDKYVKINFTFFISDNIEKLLKNNDTIVLYNNFTKFDFTKINFLKSKQREKIERGNITLILEKEEYSHATSYKKRIMSQFYKVHLIVSSKELNVTINSQISNNDELGHKVRIYSFILSIFGLIEIVHILKLIMNINDNPDIANKLSIFSIIINCYFKAMICIMHFFLSISTTDEDMSYQFGVPTIIYFFGFTGFELKLLLLVFRKRNNRLGNQELYRKRLLCLYLFFYFSLSFMILNIKECLTNYLLILFVYCLSWLCQILYSIGVNTRPPMSRMYIVSLSLSRLYLPIYIKGLDGNIFDLKPSYLKVSSLIIITFIEVIILLLQKSFGARTILPKKFRRRGFDYYRDKVNIEMHVSKNPNCVICLESLNVEVDENFNTVTKKEKVKTSFDKILHLCYFDKVEEKIKKWLKNMEGKNDKKKYMITPCDHVFHTLCLEKWMRQKNECPYCKGVLPALE